MGARLAKIALTRHELRPSTRIVFLAMSIMALDTPSNGNPANIYFGGHDYLAEIIGGESEESRKRTVKRAVAELVDLGLLERVDPGRKGHRAVYKVHPDMPPVPF